MNLENKHIQFLTSEEEIIYTIPSVCYNNSLQKLIIPTFIIFISVSLDYMASWKLNSIILPIVLIVAIYVTYLCLSKKIGDIYTTGLILTTKKLIITEGDKVTLVNYNQIKSIHHKLPDRSGVTGTIIKLHQNKTYLILYSDADKIKQELEKVYPNYVNEGLNSQIKDFIILSILLAIGFGIPYLYFVVFKF